MTVLFLFLAINLTPKTIFIVLDLWRWLEVMLFGLRILLLFRGVQNVFAWEYTWSIRAWLFYGCSVMVFFLCFVFNMIPETYFIFC